MYPVRDRKGNAHMNLKKLVLLAVACVLAGAANAEDGKHHAAIEAAVYDYFHGQGEASAERLNNAFAAEQATMVGVARDDEGNESVVAWKDMTEVIGNWAANENPPGGDRDGEILALEMVDERLAVVLFRSTDRFYDALTLAQVDGQWRIIQKAFVQQ